MQNRAVRSEPRYNALIALRRSSCVVHSIDRGTLFAEFVKKKKKKKAKEEVFYVCSKDKKVL